MMMVFQILEIVLGEAVCCPLLVRLVEWSQTAPVRQVVERIAASASVNVRTDILLPEELLADEDGAPAYW